MTANKDTMCDGCSELQYWYIELHLFIHKTDSNLVLFKGNSINALNCGVPEIESGPKMQKPYV